VSTRTVWIRFTRWEQQLSAGQICLIYAVLASSWILLSDRILAFLVSDPSARLTFGIFKGWLFVAVSALLLYGLISRMGRRVRESEAQLAHADRLASVGTMAASVAHEVNNPLTTIKVLIHTFRDRVPAGDAGRKDLDVALGEIDKIRALILRFLQFARPGEPEWSAVRVEDVVQRVTNLVRPQATSRQIHINEQHSSRGARVRADSTQLGQVVLNLMLNAVEAAPEGGSIEVETTALEDQGVRIRVWNSGESLPAGLATRIFEPFFTTKAQGTGLGLAIASAIVEKHGGRISARGLMAGGTELVVDLPEHGETKT
jgi:signal transduction histidine kinase